MKYALIIFLFVLSLLFPVREILVRSHWPNGGYAQKKEYQVSFLYAQQDSQRNGPVTLLAPVSLLLLLLIVHLVDKPKSYVRNEFLDQMEAEAENTRREAEQLIATYERLNRSFKV